MYFFGAFAETFTYYIALDSPGSRNDSENLAIFTEDCYYIRVISQTLSYKKDTTKPNQYTGGV